MLLVVQQSQRYLWHACDSTLVARTVVVDYVLSEIALFDIDRCAYLCHVLCLKVFDKFVFDVHALYRHIQKRRSTQHIVIIIIYLFRINIDILKRVHDYIKVDNGIIALHQLLWSHLGRNVAIILELRGDEYSGRSGVVVVLAVIGGFKLIDQKFRVVAPVIIVNDKPWFHRDIEFHPSNNIMSGPKLMKKRKFLQSIRTWADSQIIDATVY